MNRFVLSKWILTGITILNSSCTARESDNKDSSSKNSALETPSGPASPTTTSAATQTDTVIQNSNVSPHKGSATIVIDARAIATHGKHLAEIIASNTTAAAGSMLYAQNLSQATSAGTSRTSALGLIANNSQSRHPVETTHAVASGAPDEMIVYVKRIEITSHQAYGGRDSELGAVALQSKHVGRFDSQHQAVITPLVGLEHEDFQALINAISQATGVAADVVRQKLKTPFLAGELSIDDVDSAVARSVLFVNDSGTPVKIANGKVDLTELWAAAGKNEFKITAGTYCSIKVVFANKARVKGCVPMRFACQADEGGNRCSTNSSSADIPGNFGKTAPEDLLYCTQTAHSPYTNTLSQNSDFLQKEPEIMDLPLGQAAPEWPSGDDIVVKFPIGKITQPAIGYEQQINDGDRLDVTIVFDLNRLLRYYNRGSTERGPSTYAPKDRAYFYSSTFHESVHGFIGRPGKIYSYDALASMCDQDDSYNAQNDSCGSTNLSNRTQVGMAISIVTLADGSPAAVSVQPDDDYDPALIIGTIGEHQRCFGDDNPKWVHTNKSDGNLVDMHWAFCDNASDPLRPGPHSTLIGFPNALDAHSARTMAVPFADSDTTGSFTASLESVIREKSSEPGKTWRGKVEIKRRL